MSFVNFIEFNTDLEKAHSITTSPVIKIHTRTGIQLLPNNPLPYTQTTNVYGGIELEDWTVYIVNLCTGAETDITAQFLVDRIFQDTNGHNQFDWKLTNVPHDFGHDLVYLKAEQSIGETFYSNPFQLTEYQSERTCRLDYRKSKSDTMQSVQVQMHYWQQLKALEISSYYETSTGNTVTTTVKSQKHQRWITPFISNDLMIKITDVFENKYVYVDLVRAYLYESPEIKEFQSEGDFAENIIKLSFNKNDVFDPLYVAPVSIVTPNIVLNSVTTNSINAIYDFTISNFTPNSLVLQYTQDTNNWTNSQTVGVSSPQQVAFSETGTWYFRVIHQEAVSNTVQLDLGSDVEAVNDSVNVVNGQSIDINVLFNDTLVGNTTVTSVSSPSNGTATIIDNGSKVRYIHDGSSTLYDSFTYTIGNGISSDTATVNISIYGELTTFVIALDGQDSLQTACNLYSINTFRFHNGDSAIPTINDVIYENNPPQLPFNGEDKYYAIADGRAIKISTTGIVTDVQFC